MTESETVAKAISAALIGNWEEAVRLNTDLLKSHPDNIDALNRLGFANLQIGNASQAKTCFTKVLSLDRYNHIAEKNLNKLSVIKKKPTNGPREQVHPLTFLEEPGKTKIINCTNVAPTKALSSISSGQEVYLKVKKHVIEIRDEEGTYLAVLPDDISFKLIKYIEGGNQYKAHVKSVSKNSLVVFLREISRGKKFEHQPSFTPSTGFIGGTRQDISSGEKPDMSATGEETPDVAEG